MKHGDSFYIKKYNQLRGYMWEEDIMNPYKNWREFKSHWNAISEDGSDHIMRDIKYSLRFKTDYKTALQFKQFSDTDMKLDEIKRKTTKELAEMFYKDIMEDYTDIKRESGSATEAKKYISTHWFGSD